MGIYIIPAPAQAQSGTIYLIDSTITQVTQTDGGNQDAYTYAVTAADTTKYLEIEISGLCEARSAGGIAQDAIITYLRKDAADLRLFQIIASGGATRAYLPIHYVLKRGTDYNSGNAFNIKFNIYCVGATLANVFHSAVIKGVLA